MQARFQPRVPELHRIRRRLVHASDAKLCGADTRGVGRQRHHVAHGEMRLLEQLAGDEGLGGVAMWLRLT